MKKPEEIKKGLECCMAHGRGRCTDCKSCPFRWKTPGCEFRMHRYALAYIQQLEARVPRWIPVEERLPEPDVFVLVGYKRYGLVFEGCYSEDEKVWCDREYSYIGHPSHWMPLPEPPKEVQHE